METYLYIGSIGVIAIAACLFAACQSVAYTLNRRRASVAAQGNDDAAAGLIAWRLRNGFGFAKPIALGLLRIKRVENFVDELVVLLGKRGWHSTAESVLSILVTTMLFLTIIVWLAIGNGIGALACVLSLAALLAIPVSSEREKRSEAIRESVPDALESMGACFSSGFTLLQTFSQVANDLKGPLSDTFARCAHILETGGSAEESLSELRRSASVPELAFVAVALDVQHQSGGAMRQVLEAASDTVKGSLSLRRSLRVQTAQAKLSARIVSIMPILLIAIFSLISPGFLTPFFSSFLGYALLAVAILMQVAGIVLVRHALSVEGVS